MSKSNGTAVAEKSSWTDNPISFKPFMAPDEITLSVRGVQRFLSTKTKLGHTCSDEQALRFIMLCKARQLNPYEGDAYLVGYDSKDGPTFSLITAHQAFLKRAEIHPEYDGMESGVIAMSSGKIIDLDGDFLPDGMTLLGGWATVHFKNRSYPMKKRLKLSTFNKGVSQWQSNACGMIVKCAEADALRSSFPTSLGGMFLADEMPDANGPAAQQNRPKTLMEMTKPLTIESTATMPKTTTPAIVEQPDEQGELPPPPEDVAKSLLDDLDAQDAADARRKAGV